MASFEIAPDGTYQVLAAGTPETFQMVPTSSAGTTYLDIDSSADHKPTVRLDGQFGSVGGSKTKSLGVITIPKVNAETGVIRYNTFRLEGKIHPEDESAVLPELKAIAMALLNKAIFDSLWKYGYHESAE